jgi:hypothetical protein
MLIPIIHTNVYIIFILVVKFSASFLLILSTPDDSHQKHLWQHLRFKDFNSSANIIDLNKPSMIMHIFPSWLEHFQSNDISRLSDNLEECFRHFSIAAVYGYRPEKMNPLVYQAHFVTHKHTHSGNDITVH